MSTYNIPGTNAVVNINDSQGGQLNFDQATKDLEIAAANSQSFRDLISNVSSNYQTININFVQSKSTLNTQFSSERTEGNNWNIYISTNSSVIATDGNSSRPVTFIDGVTHELSHAIAPGELSRNYDPNALQSDEAYARDRTTNIEKELEASGVAAYNNVDDNTRTIDLESTDEGIPYLSGGMVPYGSGASGGRGASHRFDDYLPDVDSKTYEGSGNLTSEEHQHVDGNGNTSIEVYGSNALVELDPDQSGAQISVSVGSGDVIGATGASITFAAGTTGNVLGQNDTVTLQSNTGSSVGVQGTGMVVNGDGGNDLVNLAGEGTTATVNGGGLVGLTANNETLHVGLDQRETIEAAPGTSQDTIYADNSVIDLPAGWSGSIYGEGLSINMTPGSGSQIDLYGYDDAINGREGNSVTADAYDPADTSDPYAPYQDGDPGPGEPYDPGGSDPTGPYDPGDPEGEERIASVSQLQTSKASSPSASPELTAHQQLVSAMASFGATSQGETIHPAAVSQQTPTLAADASNAHHKLAA